MIKNVCVLVFLLSALLVSACGGNSADFTLLDESEGLPSVVTIKFQLQDSGKTPLPDLQTEDFILKEDGELISAYESAMEIINDPKRFLRATVLLLDMSGSIVNSNSLGDLQKAAKSFVNKIIDGQYIAIYTFDGREELQRLIAFTDSEDDLKDAIDSLDEYEMVDNSTNLNGAVVNGIAVLENKELYTDNVDIFAGSMVVFTDGKDLAARLDNDKAKKAVKDSEYNVYSVGMGSAIDRGYLKDIGKNGYYFPENATEIREAFELAADNLKARADSYYIFSYCSPKRSGWHELELSVVGLGGSLKQKFDADGFEGGCTSDDFVTNDNLVIRIK